MRGMCNLFMSLMGKKTWKVGGVGMCEDVADAMAKVKW